MTQENVYCYYLALSRTREGTILALTFSDPGQKQYIPYQVLMVGELRRRGCGQLVGIGDHTVVCRECLLGRLETFCETLREPALASPWENSASPSQGSTFYLTYEGMLPQPHTYAPCYSIVRVCWCEEGSGGRRQNDIKLPVGRSIFWKDVHDMEGSSQEMVYKVLNIVLESMSK